jgi:hypothetical protein
MIGMIGKAPRIYPLAIMDKSCPNRFKTFSCSVHCPNVCFGSGKKLGNSMGDE